MTSLPTSGETDLAWAKMNGYTIIAETSMIRPASMSYIKPSEIPSRRRLSLPPSGKQEMTMTETHPWFDDDEDRTPIGEHIVADNGDVFLRTADGWLEIDGEPCEQHRTTDCAICARPAALSVPATEDVKLAVSDPAFESLNPVG